MKVMPPDLRALIDAALELKRRRANRPSRDGQRVVDSKGKLAQLSPR
jgi:hypothetical protein